MNQAQERNLAHSVALILGIIALIYVYAKASTMHYEDEKKLFAFYCEQVENGNWPDYKDARDECKELKP